MGPIRSGVAAACLVGVLAAAVLFAPGAVGQTAPNTSSTTSESSTTTTEPPSTTVEAGCEPAVACQGGSATPISPPYVLDVVRDGPPAECARSVSVTLHYTITKQEYGRDLIFVPHFTYALPGGAGTVPVVFAPPELGVGLTSATAQVSFDTVGLDEGNLDQSHFEILNADGTPYAGPVTFSQSTGSSACGSSSSGQSIQSVTTASPAGAVSGTSTFTG